MSHAPLSDDDAMPELKPRPKRRFELSNSTPSSPASTPLAEYQSGAPQPGLLQTGANTVDGASTPSRTRSILNLTSSTLFGIYSPTGYATEREEPTTPWGTGAETPVDTSPKASMLNLPDTVLYNGPDGPKRRRRSTAVQMNFHHHRPRTGLKGYWLPLFGRSVALFSVGVLYGLLISHLHDRQQLAPVKVEGIDHSAWYYLVFWGCLGVVLGHALPWFDAVWTADEDQDIEEMEEQNSAKRENRGMGSWNDVVRSIGAFVGIAYAIRKLPWQSTLQLSLTLALANPAIWYLIDRTAPGFILPAIVAISSTGVLFGVNPALVPSPSPKQVLQSHVGRQGSADQNATGIVPAAEDLVLGLFSHESVGVATWIASVLFVSAVCFGNIGRRLVPKQR